MTFPVDLLDNRAEAPIHALVITSNTRLIPYDIQFVFPIKRFLYIKLEYEGLTIHCSRCFSYEHFLEHLYTRPLVSQWYNSSLDQSTSNTPPCPQSSIAQDYFCSSIGCLSPSTKKLYNNTFSRMITMAQICHLQEQQVMDCKHSNNFQQHYWTKLKRITFIPSKYVLPHV